MLATDSETPFVSETSVGLDLVQSFDIFSELGLENVRSHLQVLAFFVVSEPVEEPSRDSVSFGVVNDVSDGIALLFGELACSKPGVNSQDFADQESESPADTSDRLQGEGYSSFPINVGVEDTVDMLEGILSVFNDQRHMVK